MFNVFAAPGEVFDEVKASPPGVGNWLGPALVVILISWLGAWLIFSQDSIQQQLRDITDQAIEQQIAKAKMPPEQAEQARQVGAKYGSIGTKVSMAAGPVFYAFITPFWWGLIFWLAGTKALKGSFTYMKAVEVAGLANMIGALEGIVKSLLIVTFGSLFASPSLALVALKDFNPQNPVHGLLSMVNVMTFWLLAVRAIGLARLSGASFAKAAVWVFGIWALFTGSMFGLGQAMQAIFSR
jgi:hypothetical protein